MPYDNPEEVRQMFGKKMSSPNKEGGGSTEVKDEDYRKTLHAIMSAIEGADKPGPDTHPPAWVRDEDIWEKAKKATDEGAGASEPWAYVAAVYQKMGGKIGKKS